MKKIIAFFEAFALMLAAAGCSADLTATDEVEGFFGGITAEGGDHEIYDAPSGSAEGGEDADCINNENGEITPIEPRAGLLTGGEWKDNDHWSDWNALYQSRGDWSEFKESWRIDWDERVCVKVTANGKPAANAKVYCDGAVSAAVTDNNGTAYLFFGFANSADRQITVEYNGETKTIAQTPENKDITCEFDSEAFSEKSLDLMIVCDTTGSMSDELEYLKTELSDIILRIKNENANLPTRISVNFYRDEGDEYVVRPFDFTTDINTVVSQISTQKADGGGDYPEAVHSALINAVNEHNWNDDSVKIMFLVLDAPPHSDAQIIAGVNKSIADAAEKGIRIIPIASSGIDKSTEYLLRTMAIQTGGTYTFLTNDSGIGGDHIEPTVGAYNVERLGDMMVRIVGEYLK
ncbi:MAG: VWA domain-containing protein [Oscillospiraceae bacterium]|nr:VWA domain-containing protein [Oscillospiraceae bacterium]